MLLAGIAPASVLFLGMLFLNDTPRWLVLKGRDEDAKNAFIKIQGNIDTVYEISEIKKSFNTDRGKLGLIRLYTMPPQYLN